MAQQIKKKFLSPEVVSYFDDQIKIADDKAVNEKLRAEIEEGKIRSEFASADASKLAEAKAHAESEDVLKLAEAKAYSDSQDALKLAEAKAHAESEDSIKLQAAKDYADSQDVSNLAIAKSHAESQDALKLIEAKEYAQLKIAEAKSEIMGGIPSSTLDTIKEIADAIESEQTATGAILTQLGNLESSKASKTELSSGVAEAKAYTDQKISEIPAVDLSPYEKIVDVNSKDAAKLVEAKAYADSKTLDEQNARLLGDANLQGQFDNLDGYAQDIRSDLDNLDGYAQDIRSDLDSEVAVIDSRLDVLEAKVDGPSFNNEKLTVLEGQLGFVELSMQAKKIMSCAVGRLAVHEGEDFDVSIVNGKSRIVWKGSLLSPSGEECVEVGMNVFVVYAY